MLFSVVLQDEKAVKKMINSIYPTMAHFSYQNGAALYIQSRQAVCPDLIGFFYAINQ
jgi:hypothetical protein